MISGTQASFATYNVLKPYYAVFWNEKPGLTEEGKALSLEELKASTKALDEYAWKIYSNWDERCPTIAKNIQDADVVCLQEISKEIIENLQRLTKKYKLAIDVYHSSKRPVEEYGNAILYQAEKIKLKENFELEYISTPGTRRAACGVFEVGGKTVKVASVHLAGYYKGEKDLEKKLNAKKNGYEELQAYLKILESDVDSIDGIVIGGDFNESPSEKEYDLYRPGLLSNNGYFTDGNLSVTRPASGEHGRHIDWLFYKPLNEKTVSLSTMDLEKIQKQASDHLMIGTKVTWDT